MAKGIAGGFPLGAFACTEEVAARFELGDHGGTTAATRWAVPSRHAVISHLTEIDAEARVAELGAEALAELSSWAERYPAS